jgi:hypothetical protein
MVLIGATCFYIGGPAVFPGLMNLVVAFVFLQSMGFPADRYMRSIPAFAYDRPRPAASGAKWRRGTRR